MICHSSLTELVILIELYPHEILILVLLNWSPVVIVNRRIMNCFGCHLKTLFIVKKNFQRYFKTSPSSLPSLSTFYYSLSFYPPLFLYSPLFLSPSFFLSFFLLFVNDNFIICLWQLKLLLLPFLVNVAKFACEKIFYLYLMLLVLL